MTYCINCGQDLPANAQFCPNCGTKVDNTFESNRKTVFEGTIHKCPSCGEVIDYLSSTCKSCGFEFRNMNSSIVLKEFHEKYISTISINEKIDLVKTFAISNSKEDIFEFMILASSNISSSIEGLTKIEINLQNAWLVKINQIYEKAKLALKKEDLEKIESIYAEVNKKVEYSKKLNKANNMISLLLNNLGQWIALLIFVIAFFLDIFFWMNTSMFHVGGGAIMIISAYTLDKQNHIKKIISMASALLSIILGMILQEVFWGNGSMMIVSGGIALIITAFKFKKN